MIILRRTILRNLAFILPRRIAHGLPCFCKQNYSSGVTDPEYDIIVIGGGILGTASAREILYRHPFYKIAIIEKESTLAVHQSGHNSGVIHAGIYYKPGSLKAKLCVEGLHLAYKYCDEEKIQYKKCGKLIVAANNSEISSLQDLYNRSLQNKVPDVQMIEGSQIKDYEPYCQGVKALWSPHTGIVDWSLVTNHYGKNFEDRGGKIHFNFEAAGFKAAADSQGKVPLGNKYPVKVISKNNQVLRCSYVLTCGGLQSDLLAEMSGCSGGPRILPIRGEYLLLKPEKTHLVRGNIYPVPDPRFPFLGVHLTPRLNGDVWLGPNAILAMKREGYSWREFDMKDFLSTISYRGLQKMALRYANVGIKEIIGSLMPSLQVRNLQRYIPQITTKDVIPGPSGVRAQAVNYDGSLEDDFVFQRDTTTEVGCRILHCRNAPSPGATSSLAIAKMIADKFAKEFQI